MRTRIRNGPGWWWLAPLAAVLLVAACTSTTDAQREQEEPTEAPVNVLMAIEVPVSKSVKLPFIISGWALNEDSVDDPGIDRVQVLDRGCEGEVIGVAEFGLPRPDIARKYGDQFEDSSWLLEVTRLHSGERTLAVRVFTDGSTEYDACETLPVIVAEETN